MKKCLLFLPIGNPFEQLHPLSFGIITSKKGEKFKYWQIDVKKTFFYPLVLLSKRYVSVLLHQIKKRKIQQL